jgi:hypothetical protein
MEDDGKVLARLEVQVEHLSKSLERFDAQLEHYVRISRYRPVEIAVWGLVSLLCGSLITALLQKVLH